MARISLHSARWMVTHPQTYTGRSGEKEPRSFYLGNQQFDILEIQEQWVSDYRYFKVKAKGGKFYVLRNTRIGDNWEVAQLSAQR